MRRLVSMGLLGLLLTSSTGCFLNMYSADPVRRYRQLFYQSEDLRLIEDEIERFWMIDQPSNLSPYFLHGLGQPMARRYRLSAEDKGGFEQRFK